MEAIGGFKGAYQTSKMGHIYFPDPKLHVDSEFHIFAYLGEDLPGALVAEPMEPEDVPVNEYTAMILA